MKTTALFFIALFFGAIGFTQVKYKPKVVVLFTGEKNTTFDESKFPNCEFYYTPGITLETKKSKSKLFNVIVGSGFVSEYKGSPKELYFTKMAGATFFDKNGVISGRYLGIDRIQLSPKKNLYGIHKLETYRAFSKKFVKKGKTTKKAKRTPRKPKVLFDYFGMQLPKDFDVEDASGKKVSLQSLVSGEGLTLLYVLYFDTKIDLKKGFESGANKKGIDFLKDGLSTSGGIGALGGLENFEVIFFGNRVTW